MHAYIIIIMSNYTVIVTNENTVRGCKKAYIAERSAKRLREEDLSVNELQPKKKGRSLLLG